MKQRFFSKRFIVLWLGTTITYAAFLAWWSTIEGWDPRDVCTYTEPMLFSIPIPEFECYVDTPGLLWKFAMGFAVFSLPIGLFFATMKYLLTPTR